MAKFDLKEYARRGAEARATELTEELETIYAAFPELRRSGARAARARRASGRGPSGAARAASATRARRRRKPMTAAQRKAVGARMKKYWEARRKAKAAQAR